MMGARFITHDERLFGRILGSWPTLEHLLQDNRYPFAHEAGVYLAATDKLLITSNRFCDEGSHQQRVQISKVTVGGVVMHTDGSIWFTDPLYGFEQGYRPRPSLPSQGHRRDLQRGSIRAVADGFGHPNGLCFSPDEGTIYITYTDRWHGFGVSDGSKASSM